MSSQGDLHEVRGEGSTPIAILFSGGLDSMILGALLDKCLNPKCKPSHSQLVLKIIYVVFHLLFKLHYFSLFSLFCMKLLLHLILIFSLVCLFSCF